MAKVLSKRRIHLNTVKMYMIYHCSVAERQLDQTSVYDNVSSNARIVLERLFLMMEQLCGFFLEGLQDPAYYVQVTCSNLRPGWSDR